MICTPTLFSYDGCTRKDKGRTTPGSQTMSRGFMRMGVPQRPPIVSPPRESCLRKRPAPASFSSSPQQRQCTILQKDSPPHIPVVQQHSTPPTPSPTFHGTSQSLRLVVGCYNLAGATISLERFSAVIRAICQLPEPPQLIALGEFKPTGADISAFHASTRLHSHGRYHLCASPGMPTDGIALLISPDLTHSGPPQIDVILPHRIIAFKTRIFPSADIPPVTFLAVYGSIRKQDRFQIERALAPFLKEHAAILGDLNAISFLSDAHGLSANYASTLLWPWLAHAEERGTLVDCVRHLANGSPPKTRVRGYQGCSYLDRILLSQSLFSTTTPSHFSVQPLLLNGQPAGDHDMVMVDLLPWGWEVKRPSLCQGWNSKHIRAFQARLLSDEWLREVAFDSLHPAGQIQACSLLQERMLSAMSAVNAARPVRPRAQEMSWHCHVRSLLRLARRNPACFFRRVRHDLLLPMLKPRLPLAASTLLKLVQCSHPWDPAFVSSLPQQRPAPHIPLPSDDELRSLSRTPRAKSPGPDGMPPYLVYVLPAPLFHWLATGIRLSLQLEHVLPHFLNSTLVGVFKNKERWWEPSSWRPICMSTAAYRIAARFLKASLLSVVQQQIHPHQYGGLPGKTTAMATLRVQELIFRHKEPKYLLLLDISNAFSSTPFPVMLEILRRAGVPPTIVSLVERLCYAGFLFLPGDETPHRACSGARQGCPLSPLIFLLIFDPILQHLRDHHPTAFMDDLALVLSTVTELQQVSEEASLLLSRLGLRVNWPKCEWMPLDSHDSFDSLELGMEQQLPSHGWWYQPLPTPNGLPPPAPFTGCTQPPRQAVAPSTHVLHLGHLLTPTLDHTCALQILQPLQLQEIKAYHNRPIPIPGRLKVLNQILIPRFIYQLECLPPHPNFLQTTMSSLEKFILGTVGVPAFLCKKTLYSHHKAGLGMHHLENRVLTRLVDNVHKAHRVWSTLDPDHPRQWCHFLLSSAAALLGASTLSSIHPRQSCMLDHLRHPLQPLTAVPEIDAAYLPTTHHAPIPKGQVFTDGSYDPPSGLMGSAVLLPQGQAAILKPPGKGSSYVAELYALALGTILCPMEAEIFSDSQGALAAVKGSSPRVFHSSLVDICRSNVAAKHLRLHHVKGHSGLAGNEEADRLAKLAALTLPMPAPQVLRHILDIRYSGRLQSPPHKTWTRYALPAHKHESISHASWDPLRRDLRWLRWNFACVCAPGFPHPKTYWFNEPSPTPCPWCATHHNQSVHGALTCACPANPFVAAWLQSWGPQKGICHSWWTQAGPRDRYLLGKLVIPCSLHERLRDLLGARAAKASIRHFQNTILRLLPPLLPSYTTAQKASFRKRPNPWIMTDWLSQSL